MLCITSIQRIHRTLDVVWSILSNTVSWSDDDLKHTDNGKLVKCHSSLGSRIQQIEREGKGRKNAEQQHQKRDIIHPSQTRCFIVEFEICDNGRLNQIWWHCKHTKCNYHHNCAHKHMHISLNIVWFYTENRQNEQRNCKNPEKKNEYSANCIDVVSNEIQSV